MKKDIQKSKVDYDVKLRKMKLDYDIKLGKMKLDYENKNKNIKKEIGNLKIKLNNISDNLIYPITRFMINKPVITPSGITYERNAII